MNSIEERARKAYPENHPCDYECREGFRKACEEYESLPKIRGWVARHKNGELCLFSNKPEYKLALGWVDEHQHWRVINRKLFPEITSESEPVEVELIIRKV